MTDAKGQVFAYTFDALNRETNRSYPVPSPTTGDDLQSIATQYDENNNVVKVTELWSGASGTRVTAKSYDPFDRLTETTDAFGERIGYQYDANGNRTVLADPDGKATRYTFDALNRVTTVINPAGTTAYEYDRSSLPTKTSYPNGTSSVTAYDPAKRVLSVNNKQGASILSTYAYTYDANGNRLTQVEANGGVAQTTAYGYDNNDRLTSVAYPDKTTSYTYDPAYNRLSEKTVNTASTVEADKTFSYNPRNQLTTISDAANATSSVAYDYDANGNQTIKTKNGVTTTFIYDVRDQLISVRENATTLGLFRYDYAGFRTLKDMGGQIVRYTYDHDSVLVESDNTGATVAKFDYGATRLLSLNHVTEGRQFYLFDALGSVSNLTSSTGALQARYQYDAFGQFRAQAGSSFNRFAFTGHEKDTETGLYYFKARFYDPDTGRFLSQDAYLGEVSTPPSLHRYLYAYGNPTVYVDLNGYEACYGYCPPAQRSSEEQHTYDAARDADRQALLARPRRNSFEVADEQAAEQRRADTAKAAQPRLVRETEGSPGSDPEAAQIKRDFQAPLQRNHDLVARGGDIVAETICVGPCAAYGVVSGRAGSSTSGETLSGKERVLAGIAGGVPLGVVVKGESKIAGAIEREAKSIESAAAKTEGRAAGEAAKTTSTASGDVTYLYQKVGSQGEHLKFGITKNPATRYTKEELSGGKLRIIGQGERSEMLRLERQLHETLPIGPEEAQKFYVQKQVEKGLKPPPYNP